MKQTSRLVRHVVPVVAMLGTLVAVGCGEQDDPVQVVVDDQVDPQNYALPALAAQPNFPSLLAERDIIEVAESFETREDLRPLRDALMQAGVQDRKALLIPAGKYLTMLPGDEHKEMFEEARGYIKNVQDETIDAIQTEAKKEGRQVDWEKLDRDTHLLSLTGTKREVRQ
jgi:hypothetical protein